jgi:carboxymethylenebutenolidase
MPREIISIRTTDGDCPSTVLTPPGTGPWPAVIFYPDGLGIRPALVEMAARLADSGYVVLLPDMFYRAGPYAPLDPKIIFAAPDIRAAIGHLLGSTDNRRAAADSAAFLDYLASRPDVAGPKVGTTGYCMGGGISLFVAGTYPQRVAAAASFHGGNLATDDALSPHRLAPSIKARVYVAGADQDKSYPPTMTDFPIYDQPAAERHWRELLALFGAVLG